MTQDLRIKMRTQSRRLKGLLNLLTDDIHHVNSDAEDYDLVCLPESIRDTKETLQMFSDEITSLEYSLYLSKQYSRD